MTRPLPILSTWRAKVAANRESQEAHHSSERLLVLLWEEGFGPIAAARMMDWWCTSHPEAIERSKK